MAMAAASYRTRKNVLGNGCMRNNLAGPRRRGTSLKDAVRAHPLRNVDKCSRPKCIHLRHEASSSIILECPDCHPLWARWQPPASAGKYGRRILGSCHHADALGERYAKRFRRMRGSFAGLRKTLGEHTNLVVRGPASAQPQ